MTDSAPSTAQGVDSADEQSCAYRVLRYTPNLVRDEWVNIGILVFNPRTGERRLRLLEDEEEYRRVRRFHPQADEALLRALRDDLEDRFRTFVSPASGNGEARVEMGGGVERDWQQLLAKWDDTLSNALQLSPQKGVLAFTDLMPSWIACMPITWRCSMSPAAWAHQAAVRACAPIARRCCARRTFGSASKNPCAPNSGPCLGIPCALITATGGMALGASCTPFRSRARRVISNNWPTPPSASTPKKN